MQHEKILAEYAKLAKVGKAIDALMEAADANNMSLHEISEVVLSMAERKIKTDQQQKVLALVEAN